MGRSNIYRLNKICDLFFMFPLQWEILDSNLSKYKVDPSNCELPMPSKKHLTQFCRIDPISSHMHNSKGTLARISLDTVTIESIRNYQVYKCFEKQNLPTVHYNTLQYIPLITGMEGSTPNLRKGSSKPPCGAVVPCYIAWLWIGPRLFVWSHCKVPSKKWKVWM